MSKLDRSDGTTLTLGALGVLAAIGALKRRTGSGAKSLGIVRVKKKREAEDFWIGHGEIYISAPEEDLVEFVADRIEQNYFDSDSGVRVSISFDEDPTRNTEEDGSRHWFTGHGEIYIIAPDADLIPLTVQTIEGMAPENVAVDVAIEQIEADEQ